MPTAADDRPARVRSAAPPSAASLPSGRLPARSMGVHRVAAADRHNRRRSCEVRRDRPRGRVFAVNPITGLLGLLGARDHLVPDFGLHRLICRRVDRRELGAPPIPLYVVSGEELCHLAAPCSTRARQCCRARRPPPVIVPAIQTIFGTARPMTSGPTSRREL
jgi:hypothetical protein